MSFISVTTLDSNGSGTKLDALIKVERIECVSNLKGHNIMGVPEGALALIKCIDNDNVAYVTESYTTLKAKLKFVQTIV